MKFCEDLAEIWEFEENVMDKWMDRQTNKENWQLPNLYKKSSGAIVYLLQPFYNCEAV
jgi:hypothetical protein